MSAIWHDNGMPSFLGIKPSFSFHELAEIHVEAPTPYQCAMEDLRIREALLGYDSDWHQHNAELAHSFYEMKKPWWL